MANFNKNGTFKVGNQASKGYGRPKSIFKTIPQENFRHILETSKEYFQKAFGKLLEEIEKGNMRAIELYFSLVLPKQMHLLPDEEVDEKFNLRVEEIRNMTSQELLEMTARLVDEEEESVN